MELDVKIMCIVAFLLLVGCAFLQPASTCDVYDDEVMEGFCETDIIIESAQALIKDYENGVHPAPPNLQDLKDQVAKAESLMNKGAAAYLQGGDIVDGDSIALEEALNLLEVWLNGS